MWKSKHSPESALVTSRRFACSAVDFQLPLQSSRFEGNKFGTLSELNGQRRPSRWGGTMDGSENSSEPSTTSSTPPLCNISLNEDRSESCPPHPTAPFNSNPTKRITSLEQHYLKKLEEQRMRVLDHAAKRNFSINSLPPEYLAQPKRSQRPFDKVYIPVKEYPDINFFGLLVGPRGNSLKKMERESGAKISIRGKGSVKEGKVRPDHVTDDVEDDLHCLVVADTEESVKVCVKLINQVIETAASTPEGQNDHKRNQLRELAALNGTLRDDENQLCQNCGLLGHRKFDCSQRHINGSNIVCRSCGNPGHIARDCSSGKQSRSQNPIAPSINRLAYDVEYPSLPGGNENTATDYTALNFSSNAHMNARFISATSDFSLRDGHVYGSSGLEDTSSWMSQRSAYTHAGYPSAPFSAGSQAFPNAHSK